MEFGDGDGDGVWRWSWGWRWSLEMEFGDGDGVWRWSLEMEMEMEFGDGDGDGDGVWRWSLEMEMQMEMEMECAEPNSSTEWLRYTTWCFFRGGVWLQGNYYEVNCSQLEEEEEEELVGVSWPLTPVDLLPLPGVQQLEAPRLVECVQQQAEAALQEYTRRASSHLLGRGAQLLPCLSELRSLAALAEDFLYGKQLSGEVPSNNLLMEMLHAKRSLRPPDGSSALCHSVPEEPSHQGSLKNQVLQEFLKNL